MHVSHFTDKYEAVPIVNKHRGLLPPPSSYLHET